MPMNVGMTFHAHRDGLAVQGNHDLLPSRSILGISTRDVGHPSDTMDLQIAIAIPTDLTHGTQDSLAQMQTSGEAGKPCSFGACGP